MLLLDIELKLLALKSLWVKSSSEFKDFFFLSATISSNSPIIWRFDWAFLNLGYLREVCMGEQFLLFKYYKQSI